MTLSIERPTLSGQSEQDNRDELDLPEPRHNDMRFEPRHRAAHDVGTKAVQLVQLGSETKPSHSPIVLGYN